MSASQARRAPWVVHLAEEEARQRSIKLAKFRLDTPLKPTNHVGIVSEVTTEDTVSPSAPGWKELWSKEDWWAVWLGLGTVIIAYAFFKGGSTYFLAGRCSGEVVNAFPTRRPTLR